ncbi:MAG TPA: hypothetical protein ENI56_00590 [Candidatus Kaiserbacteria bacterium]|nr:hypothetical protein [Candidatus Kaiserbacteria bacterium]
MNKRTEYHPKDILRHVQHVADYYGFLPFSSLTQAKQGTHIKHEPYQNVFAKEKLDPMAQLTVAFLKRVRSAGLKPSIQQPLFVWHTNITPGRTAPKQSFIQFHAIGVPHVIAEAVLLHATNTLIRNVYKSEPTIRLNSIGDKETRVRFTKELEQYFQKNDGDEIPQECMLQAKHGVFSGAEALVARHCADTMPQSINVLSEASRRHLENLIELLEETKLSYTLASDLITHENAWSETCFEIQVDDERAAWGSRYEHITKSFFDIALPSVVMIVRLYVKPVLVVAKQKRKSPIFIFIHIGIEAKRISIMFAQEFQKAHLPLLQMIGVESLTEQIRIAETLHPQYLLIMGRKEALEETVILRHCSSYTETILPLDTLVQTIKEMVQ